MKLELNLCTNKCSNKNAKVLGINKDENRTLTTYFSDDDSVCFGTFSVCIFISTKKKWMKWQSNFWQPTHIYVVYVARCFVVWHWLIFTQLKQNICRNNQKPKFSEPEGSKDLSHQNKRFLRKMGNIFNIRSIWSRFRLNGALFAFALNSNTGYR